MEQNSDIVRLYKRADRLIHELMPGSFVGIQVGRRVTVEEHFFQRAYGALYKDEQAELIKLLNDVVEIFEVMQKERYRLKVALIQQLDPSPDPEYQFWAHLHDEFNGRSFQFVPTVEYVRQQIMGNNIEVYVGPQGKPYLDDVNTLWPSRVVHGWRGRAVSLPAQDRAMLVTPRIVLFEPPAHLEAIGIWVGVRDKAHAKNTVSFFRGIMKHFAGRRNSPIVQRIEQLLQIGYKRSAARVDEPREPGEILAGLQELLGSEQD